MALCTAIGSTSKSHVPSQYSRIRTVTAPSLRRAARRAPLIAFDLAGLRSGAAPGATSGASSFNAGMVPADDLPDRPQECAAGVHQFIRSHCPVRQQAGCRPTKQPSSTPYDTASPGKWFGPNPTRGPRVWTSRRGTGFGTYHRLLRERKATEPSGRRPRICGKDATQGRAASSTPGVICRWAARRPNP